MRSAHWCDGCSTCGIERISIDRGVTPEEIADLIHGVNTLERRDNLEEPFEFPTLAHIRVGRVTVDQRVEGNLPGHGDDQASLQQLCERRRGCLG